MVSYLDQLPAEIRDTDDPEVAARYLERAHGDIEDAKTTLIMIADEKGWDLGVDDIEAVTDEEPLETFQ